MTNLASIISRAAYRQPMKALARTLHRTALPAIWTADGSLDRFQAKHSLHSESSNNSKSHLIDKDGYLQFNTLHEMITNATTLYGENNSPLFGTFASSSEAPQQDGSFQWMSYKDFATKVTLCRSVLKNQLGVTPYSKVGIISNNRHEWATLAAATYSLNATLVPMYEAQLPKDWIHILNDSECRALFCSTEDIYRKVKQEVVGSAPLVNEVLCLDAPVEEPHSFGGAMGRAEIDHVFGIEKDKEEEDGTSVVEPLEDDLANLIYTSGTTGKPKGVELLHSNQVSNIKAGRDMGLDPSDFPSPQDRSLAFLPWAHSYGQTCELWCLMSQGASMGICRGIPHILDDLQMVKPTLLYAVPTLYKRVHDGVINTMNNASPIQQTLMRTALRLGKADAARRNGIVDEHSGEVAPPFRFIDSLKYKVLDDIVLKKIRDRFGGNLRAGFVAGAACPKEIIDFMDSIGIAICEGYGLTETSPVIALNVLSRRKAGSVGQVLNGVDVWIVDSEGNALGPGEEGEICCSGPNVMKGYHNNPTATDEVITLAPDGKSRLFHTGDLGKLGSDGFLSVTGRIKEQYKLENGKYVCPSPIQEAIGLSRFISQVVVCGDNRPYNIALVVPDWLAIRNELGLSEFDAPEEEMVNDSRVKGILSAEIKLNCYNIKKFEVPAAFMIVSPFTAANNMLTPKMSIRRHVVMKSYKELISGVYDGHIQGGGYLRNDNLEAA